MTETILRKSIYLKATPAQVWAYLTDPNKLAIWFHKPESPLLTGNYKFIGTDSGETFMWGNILIVEPFSRLEYTFQIPPMGDQISTVKWRLEAVPGGTNLTLRHEGLPQGTAAFGLTLSLDGGWDEHLMQMRTLTEPGKG